MSSTPDYSNLSSTAAAQAFNSATRAAIAKAVACPAATTLAAFLSGALTTALGHAPAASNLFILTSAQDTSDAAFQVAKGSAPAIGDMFSIAGSATTVEYVPPVSVGDAFAAIAAYLSNPPSTSAGRSNAQYASEAFGALVAAVNAISA